MKRKTRKDALPDWKRARNKRASRAKWRAKQLAAGLCPSCGKEPALKGGRGEICREKSRVVDRRAYRVERGTRRRFDELTPTQYRALVILAPAVEWTPAAFKARMWPTAGNIRGAGRVLSLLTRAGWLLKESRGYRGFVYRLNEEGRRVLALNRAFVEQAQKSEAA